MTTTATVSLTPDQAEYIEDTLREYEEEVTSVVIDGHHLTVTLGPRALDVLRSLSDTWDGHVDNRNVMWIGGTEHPLSFA